MLNKEVPKTQDTVSYQEGLKIGSAAQSPLVLLGSPEFDSSGIVISDTQRESLLGYVKGLYLFMKKRRVKTPLLIHPENLDFQPMFEGYIDGLNRQKPNIPEVLFERQERTAKDKYGTNWHVVLKGVKDLTYGEGYYLGFLLSLARDYPFNLNMFKGKIPDSPSLYKAFEAGVNAQSIASALFNGDIGLTHEEDRKSYKQDHFLSYVTGLRLWLHDHGIDIKIADELIHPEALSAFKHALNGGIIEDYEGELKDSTAPENTGYKLGKIARANLKP
ncbi:MAG: hypothetical protein M1450_00720 [Patescibacteria group bacterium]|nr:hypothetical protein [Patescibacteria group bacterium]